MTLDNGTLTLLIQLVVYITAIVGAFWKLRLMIKDVQSDMTEKINQRPTYTKVEKMIDDRAVTKEVGIAVKKDVEHLTQSVDEMKELLHTLINKFENH